ncbi:hypothetical protein WJX81_008150 [Elliptochloris bilobata]|uniref:CRAL-TRIO domain-containing protein n=1 Tax=Elliptochloris bilobata TaxID=381761 RepID=A0AAW1SAD5_9CHLO
MREPGSNALLTQLSELAQRLAGDGKGQEAPNPEAPNRWQRLTERFRPREGAEERASAVAAAAEAEREERAKAEREEAVRQKRHEEEKRKKVEREARERDEKEERSRDRARREAASEEREEEKKKHKEEEKRQREEEDEARRARKAQEKAARQAAREERRAQERAERQTRGEDEDDEPVARIVAYSDSEGEEDEPLFGAKKPPRGKAADAHGAAAGGEGGAGEGVVATVTLQPGEPPRRRWYQRSPASEVLAVGSGGRVRRAAAAARRCGAAQLAAAREAASWGLLLQMLLLALLHRWRPRAARRLELLALALPLPDALARLAGRDPVLDWLPARAQEAAAAVAGLAAPALLLQAVQRAAAALHPWPPKRVKRSISQSVLTLRAASHDEPLPPAPPPSGAGGGPPLAAQQMPTHAPAIAEMKRMLVARGVRLPQPRFDATDAELLRYADDGGLLNAVCPEERAVAIETGAQRVAATLRWLHRRRFMSPQQLQRFASVVQWQGSDAAGHPVLLVRLSRACDEFDGKAAAACAEAIISHVDRATRERLDNARGPDQLVVVLDARDASTLQVTRKVTLFKDTAVALNQHYPGRLHQLFLVGLPPSLGWVLAAVRPALHTATAAKIQQCFASDACLPPQLRRTGPNPNPALPLGMPASAASARASAASASASLAVDARSGMAPAAKGPALDAATVNGFLAPAPAAPGEPPVLPAVRLGRPGELKKRVTIPDSPVTAASGRKRPNSARAVLRGAAREPGALRPSLKRILSESALAGGPRGPSLAPSRLRRAPRSHPLPRLASDASLDSLSGDTPRAGLQASAASAALSTMLLLTILLAVLQQYVMQLRVAGMA